MAAPRPTSRQSIYARQSTAGKSLNRQSIAPPGTLSGGASSSSASSHNGPPLQYDENGHVLLSPAQQRMLDKQQEWEAFLRVNRQTEQQHQYVSQLGEKNELLVNGNEGRCITRQLKGLKSSTRPFQHFDICAFHNILTVIGKVVSNWQNVFRATHLAMGAS